MSDIVIALFWSGVCAVLLLALVSWIEPEGHRRAGGPFAYLELGEWLEEHVPDLYWRLASMPPDAQRAEMNKLTGLDVKPADLMDESSVKFLAAFKAMKEEGKC